MNWIKQYWFLIIFALGIVGSAYTLQAEQKQVKEEVKEVKEEVKEKEKDIKENDKIDIQQTVALEKISVAQSYIIDTLKALNEKIEKEKSK